MDYRRQRFQQLNRTPLYEVMMRMFTYNNGVIGWIMLDHWRITVALVQPEIGKEWRCRARLSGRREWQLQPRQHHRAVVVVGCDASVNITA